MKLPYLPHSYFTRASRAIQTVRMNSHSTLSRPLPEGTWDSHMHVVDPVRFPLDSKAKYKPPSHTVRDMREFYQPLGIKKMVFVQPSIYGNDNECMLEALREVGPTDGRAVVQFDPSTIDDATLQEWHAIGVRGVRVNLVSVGRRVELEELRQELLTYAEVIAPLNWVLEIYAPLEMADILHAIVPGLGIRVCLDHFSHPTLPSNSTYDPYELSGFKSLIEMLQGNTWVKMSAPYRLSKDPDMRDLEPLAKELLKRAPYRLVYATDWPHTRFDNIDSKPFIEECYSWCGHNEELVDRLFRKNAEELWDVPTS